MTEPVSTIDSFFERPILNSPYERPARHWKLDQSGQPTQRIILTRRVADFVAPIPMPKKQKRKATSNFSSQATAASRGRRSSTTRRRSSTRFAHSSKRGEASPTRTSGAPFGQ
jgi:hypothetical protein